MTEETKAGSAQSGMALSPPPPSTPEKKVEAGFAADPKRKPNKLWPSWSQPEIWFGWKDAPPWLGTGTMLKHRSDGTTKIQLPHGGIINDRGNRLEVHKKADWKTLEAAALVAASRFGTIIPQGNDEFMFRAWAIAERHGLRVEIPPGKRQLHQQYLDFHASGLKAKLDQALGPVTSSPLKDKAMERTLADEAKAAEVKKQQEADKQRPERLQAVAQQLRMLNGRKKTIRTDMQAVEKSIADIGDLANPARRPSHGRRPKQQAAQ